MPPATPVKHISDTARWVAMYRAQESERPDALFRDPYARRLAGPQGEEILRAMPKAQQFGWPMIVRTAVMDEFILQAVGRDGVDTVVNLAAGLDARPYRLPLGPELRWIDVDLPGILTYKQEQLANERPHCTLEFAGVDLTDASARGAIFARVGAASRRALIVTEGLLVYLTPDQVAELAAQLNEQAAFRWWLIDLAAPRLLQMLQRTWGKTLGAGGAPLRFAPAESTAFFGPHGWEEAEFRSVWHESFRLGRTMRLGRFWRFVSRFYPKRVRDQFQRMSGIVLLRRRD